MVTTKTLADLLTGARFGLAWVILWLGISDGATSLPTALWVLILAWITDVLDGPLSRHDRSGRETWIGNHDLEADVSVGVAVLAYLTVTGFVTPQLAAGYVIICAALVWHFRSPQIAWAIQAAPYLGIIYSALRFARMHGLIAIGYLALVVLGTWPRFPRSTVPQFIQAMKDLTKTARITDLPAQETSGEEPILREGNGNGHRREAL